MNKSTHSGHHLSSSHASQPGTVSADPEPEDLTGLHQSTGADLERHLAEPGSIAPPAQRDTQPSTPASGHPRLNTGIEPAAATGTTPRNNLVELPEVEPWPEPVNGSEVLNGVVQAFSRYVVLPEGAADALALWTAHTHCFESFQCSPRLNLSSPEKGCGKSTLRDVLGLLVPRPLYTEHLTRAVLFRLIDDHHPSVLADECDAWLMENEELRGLLNSGHRRGGQVFRYDGVLRAVRGFSVFAPVVLCGIGELPVTLHDRSIVIHLKRARRDETRERFDSRRVAHETELCRKLARFCADNQAQLGACDPVLPPAASNRVGDNWRPLFAIAQIAEGDWPRRAATAFARLTIHDMDQEGTGTMLLADIRQVFTARNVDKIFSKALVEGLCAMADRPWLEAHKRRPINEIWLARSLRAYGITPSTIRSGRTLKKGYVASDFEDAFARYLPPVVISSRNMVTMPESIMDFQI